MNQYIKNLETNKLELSFDKAAYLALPYDMKQDIKSAFNWSRYATAWVSRAQLDNTWRTERVLTKLKTFIPDLTDAGTKGEKLTFAERIEVKQEKAERRAERFENYATKQEDLFNLKYEKAHNMASFIPFGQPILVGHHSERGDRNFRNKIHNTFGQAFEARDKAAYFEDRAETAKDTAEAKQYQDAGFLQRRIKEVQADINKVKGYLQGKGYHNLELGKISEKDKEHWNNRLAEHQEKMDFYTGKLNELKETKIVWNKETLKGKTEVFIKGRWKGLVKCNPTTVAVENWCFPDTETRRKWPLKYQYGDIRDAR